MNELLDFLAGIIITEIRTGLREIGLKDSRIINRITYKVEGNTVSIFLPDYYRYIESGRRPGARMPPAEPIIAWMRRKRIARGNENRVSWAIRKSISKNGIQPRPFVDKAFSATSEPTDAVITMRFDELIEKEIGTFFAS